MHSDGAETGQLRISVAMCTYNGGTLPDGAIGEYRSAIALALRAGCLRRPFDRRFDCDIKAVSSTGAVSGTLDSEQPSAGVDTEF